jgi:hypothetical protein
MKNSIKRASRDKNTNLIKCVVGGLVFYPKNIPKPFYRSVHAWIEDSCPSESYVYDNIDLLISTGFPIVDAVEVNSILTRKLIGSLKEATIDLSYAVRMRPIKIKDRHLGVLPSITKAYHALNYH